MHNIIIVYYEISESNSVYLNARFQYIHLEQIFIVDNEHLIKYLVRKACII